MKNKLHFARFEFKYLLPLALRLEVESELRYFLGFDPYVESRPGHRYFVRSLYFDDHAFSNYYEKTDGVHTRAKFRVRTYTHVPGDGCVKFLELKGRYGFLVFKHRTVIDENLGKAEDEEEISKWVLRQAQEAPVRDKFEYELFRKGLRPVALIDYHRRPYVSKYDPEFRLTFDEELTAWSADSLFPSGTAKKRSILPGYTVMEVKFRYRIPSWFHRVIQSYELRRLSISKVCKGIEALELAQNLE